MNHRFFSFNNVCVHPLWTFLRDNYFWFVPKEWFLMLRLQTNCNFLFEDLRCVAASVIFCTVACIQSLLATRHEFPAKIGISSENWFHCVPAVFIVHAQFTRLCPRVVCRQIYDFHNFSPLRVSHPSWQRWPSVEIIPAENSKIEQTVQYHISWFPCLNWEQKSCGLFKKRDIEVDGSGLWRVFWSLAEPLLDAL